MIPFTIKTISNLTLFCFFLISTLANAQHSKITTDLPDDFPEITLNVFNNPSPGYIFAGIYGGDFFPNATPWLIILDNWGTPLFYRKMDAHIYDFKLQDNGHLSYFRWPRQFILDSAYNIIDTIIIQNHGPSDTDFHELLLFEDNSSFVLGFDDRLVDMDTVVPGGQPGVTVRGCLIQEQDADANVVFEWSSWDHYLITDASDFVNLTSPSFIDYVHANAIEVDSDTTIMISCRNMEEITKIDRRTGGIIWRMGGKNNQFEFINDSLNGFRRQHDIRKIANSHYSLFDNGGLGEPLISRALEYDLDETSYIATLVNGYRSQPEDIYGAIMGNAQWLPNGNIMVGWGSGVPNITEFNPDGTKAWEVEFESVSYRAFRFPWQTNYFIPESDSINFGEIHFPDSAIRTIPLKNNTDYEIQITGYHHHDSAFSIMNEFPFTIGVQEYQNIYCLFDPETAGQFQDIITIQSDINTPELTQRIARQIFVEGISSPDVGIPLVSKHFMVNHFPNPHNGIFHLTFRDKGLYKISIINISGEIVHTELANGTTYINRYLDDKPSGTYIIYVLNLNTGKSCYLRSVKL